MADIYVPDRKIVKPVLASMIKYNVPFGYRQDTVGAISDSPQVNLFYDADKGILAEDSNGLLNVTNRAAAELFGYKMTELVGMLSEKLVPERFREQRTKLFKRILEEQILVELDGLRLNKSREEIPIHGWVFPYQLGNNLSIAAAITRR